MLESCQNPYIMASTNARKRQILPNTAQDTLSNTSQGSARGQMAHKG